MAKKDKGARAFVGLGSNVGVRLRYLRAAVAALNGLSRVRAVRVSSAYQTNPVGPRQRNFLNAVVEIRTTLPPSRLLTELQRLEIQLGRRPRFRWGPREIDMDVLFYGRRRCRSKGLCVPHPRALQRKFVMYPLAEIAPRFHLPGLHLTASAVCRDRLTDPSQRIRLYRRNMFPRGRVPKNAWTLWCSRG